MYAVLQDLLHVLKELPSTESLRLVFQYEGTVFNTIAKSFVEGVSSARRIAMLEPCNTRI